MASRSQKLGPGYFWSNANSFAQLAGPFDTTIVTVVGVTVQVDKSRDGNTTAVSISPGLGLGFAKLTTNTFATTESPTGTRCGTSAFSQASSAGRSGSVK